MSLFAFALLVCGADIAVVTLRDRATAVSVEDAVGEFRQHDASATTSSPSSSTSVVGPGPATPTATAGRGSADTTAVASTGAASSPGSPPAGEAASSATRPEAGVYRYRTDGGEQVPSISASRRYPDETVATVLRAEGCHWQLRADLLAEHRDDYTFCSTSAGLDLLRVEITIEWFFVRQTLGLDCGEGIPLTRPGTPKGSRAGHCDNADMTASATVTDHPQEVVRVGDIELTARRVDLDMVFSGKFQGRARWRLWLEPSTGLPLRVVRDVDAAGETPIGRQRYVEQHRAELLDPRPAR